MSKLNKMIVLSVFILLGAIFGGLAATSTGPGVYGASMVLLFMTLMVMLIVVLAPGHERRFGERCDCPTSGPCLADRGELPVNQRCVEAKTLGPDTVRVDGMGRIMHP